MSNFNVKYIKSCKKLLNTLEKYNPRLFNHFTNMIDEILEDPFKPKFKKIQDSDRDRRNRFGDYRVVYFVKDSTVFITKIGFRKNVYKSPPGCPKLSKKKIRSIR